MNCLATSSRLTAQPWPKRTIPTRRRIGSPPVEIREFQDLMADIYRDRDAERGVPATVAWLTEELGELAQAVRKGDQAQQAHEAADVFAWLASLANQIDVDLEGAVERFANGCPRCGALPCGC